MLLRAVAACALGAQLAVAAPPAFEDVTVYRLSPKSGDAAVSGLTNVDSGNAAGDALFGLSNLLLPQLCAVEPSFLWCENRGSLSGGEQWMVYTEYTVSAKVFGDYAACNPCNNSAGGGSSGRSMAPPKCPPGKPDGTFVCEGYGGGGSSSTPKQCQSGFDVWHRDCLNGTVFKTLEDSSEGECCAACSAAKGECEGWNIPHASANGTGACQLMKQPLVMWEDGQTLSNCKAAQVSNGRDERCWYDDSEYNVSFAPFCQRSECQCEAISMQAMGREVGAMCHHNRRRQRRRRLSRGQPMEAKTAQKAQKPKPPAPVPDYWGCTAQLQEFCPFDDYRHDPQGCSACAKEHKTLLQKAGCDAAAIVHGCEGDYEGCFKAYDTVCGRGSHRKPSQSCMGCAHDPKNTPALEAANCTQYFMEYECGGGGHSSPWEDYINELACTLNGTWYSTREEGECKEGQSSGAGCLWKTKQTGRTVNQTCVDDNVIAVVEKKRPACFKKCPQPTNQSSACYLHCFFDTMVGNATLKLAPMHAADIVAPFTKSFTETDPEKGGCVSV